jgi:hypothetical protein
MHYLSISNRERREYQKYLQSITDIDDRDTIIACLFVNNQENENRLAALFNLSKDKIIEIIKKEQLYDCKICTGCFKLKNYSDYWKRSGTKNRGVMSQCKQCSSKKRKNNVEQQEKQRRYVRHFRTNLVIYDDHKNLINQITFVDKVRRSIGGYLEVECTYCGKWFKPTGTELETRTTAVNDKYKDKFGIVENRFYCSDNCKSVCPTYRKHVTSLVLEDEIRAGNINISELNREVQPELRQMVFDRDNYTCQRCGKNQTELIVGLHCHHIEGIRWNPIESADIDQCLTECETCHILIHQQPDCSYHDMKCLPENRV